MLKFSTVEHVLGRQGKQIKPWVTDEVLDLCDRKRQLRRQKHTSTEALLKYRKVNRVARKKMKAEKGEWIEEQ